MLGTLLGAWRRSGIPGIIDTEFLVRNIENKARRPKKGPQALQRTEEYVDISRALMMHLDFFGLGFLTFYGYFFNF